MTESPLLRDVLKDEWGFDGLVMSDWGAARATVGAGDAALDLAMPGPTGPWGDALVAAVRAGESSEAAVDDKVLRLLRLAARVGALEARRAARLWSPPASATRHPPAPRASPTGVVRRARRGRAALHRRGELRPRAQPRVAAAARGAARCDASRCIGPNAAVARTLGGGSATVFPPLHGLAARRPARRAAAPRSPTRRACAPHAPADRRRQSADLRFFDAAVRAPAEHREVGEFTWLGTLDPRGGGDRGPHDAAGRARRRAPDRPLGPGRVPADAGRRGRLRG